MSKSNHTTRAKEITLELCGAESIGSDVERLIEQNEGYCVLSSSFQELQIANTIAKKQSEGDKIKELLIETKKLLRKLLSDMIDENEADIKHFTGTVISTDESVILDCGYVMQSYDRDKFESELPRLGELLTIKRSEDTLDVTVRDPEDM